MGNKKLVLCCIAGIILGFLVPLFIKSINAHTSLMCGMAGGLGIGYILDILDEKKNGRENADNLSQKAREANRLMEQARAELEGRSLPDEEDLSDPEAGDPETDDSGDDETDSARALSEAEELLSKARERIRK